MKVLQFVTRLDLGGAQEIALDLCRLLLERGHDVHLVTGTGGELLDDARRLPGLRLHVWSECMHPVRPLEDVRCLARMVGFLRQERFDLLHTHASKAGLFGRLAATMARTPRRVIHHVHGWSFNEQQPPAVRALFVGLERIAARPGFVMLSCSRATNAQGRTHGIGRDADRRVVVNGVYRRPNLRRRNRDAVRRRLGIGRREVLFLQLANLKPQKDPLTFARAAVLAGRGTRRGLFWIAGDGPLRPAAERIAREGGLGERFRVLGWRRDVDDLLAAADALVLTSRFEGLPIAVLRAMAAGLPVVATRVDGTPEAVTEGSTGFLVEPGCHEGIARALSCLAASPALRRRMGCRARLRSAEFTERRVSLEVLRIYDEPPDGRAAA